MSQVVRFFYPRRQRYDSAVYAAYGDLKYFELFHRSNSTGDHDRFIPPLFAGDEVMLVPVVEQLAPSVASVKAPWED